MADLWFYTRGGQQQGPVSPADLKKLADSGSLQSSDLVWKEGMPQWVPASTVKGLFTVSEGKELPVAIPTTYGVKTEDPEDVGRRKRKADSYKDDDDEDNYEDEDAQPRRRRRASAEVDDDDFDRPARRRRMEADGDDDYEEDRGPRRRRRSAQGMSTGTKIALIVGGLGLVLILVVGVVIFALVGNGGPASGTRSFSLREGQATKFEVRFHKGNKVEIWVNSTGQSDVDLYVFDAGGREIRFDDEDSPNCYLWFLADATQTYRIEVRNMRRIDQVARNGHNSGTMKYQESSGVGVQPPPPQVHQGKIVPNVPIRRR